MIGCICKENSITKFEMRSAENVGRASKLRRTKIIAQSVLTHPGSTGAAWDATHYMLQEVGAEPLNV